MNKIRICIFTIILISFMCVHNGYGINNTLNVNCTNKNKHYELQPLPYNNNSLEPFMDVETIILHHENHEQSYIDSLNIIISEYPELIGKSVEELLFNSKALPKKIQGIVLIYAGGVFNHNFLWNSVNPQGGGNPIANLGDAIEKQYGSYENFKLEFEKSALNQIGSGWIWLLTNTKGKLTIKTTSNENPPLDPSNYPLICLDLWEHAYYLKYQNRKKDYIHGFWNIVNWDFAENNYIEALKK